ncbi:MAG: hypothetical protein RIS94_3714 [Pseudomonadota bacterium]
MEQEKLTELTVEIVKSYLSNQSVLAGSLPNLIKSVGAALAGAGGDGAPQSAAAPAKASTPAVPVAQSIRRNNLVCLDCGHVGIMLRRHLREKHGLSPSEYRTKWGLKPEYPVVLPAYARRRADIARELGLGMTSAERSVLKAQRKASEA